MGKSEMDKVNLIINADDLGANQRINRTVFELMDAGILTSATMIANGPAVEEAIEGAKKRPQCSFGVHLNITEFLPMTKSKSFEKICKGNGEFNGDRIRQISVDSELREAVRKEWSAQVAFVSSRGISVSHLDSHQHVHTIPELFPALKRVQKEFGIRRVRISKNLYPQNPGGALILKKKLWNFALRHFVRTETTDGFTSFSELWDIAKQRRPEARSIEAMVHPGHEAFEMETALLQSGWQDSFPMPFRLIPYYELGNN